MLCGECRSIPQASPSLVSQRSPSTASSSITTADLLPKPLITLIIHLVNMPAYQPRCCQCGTMLVISDYCCGCHHRQCAQCLAQHQRLNHHTIPSITKHQPSACSPP
ncbi:hypothetical protein VTJ04DRAFT_6919 [Mycothermus thermophilus]|uniref:uncharacterized protein n=1 Tax=Humicola insolens TaxID=85995 RepID=UPI003743AAE4